MLSEEQKKPYFAEGEKSEHRFGAYILGKYGGSVDYYNGTEVDKTDGIDLSWTRKDGQTFTFRVKSKKPATDLMIPCEWVELKNITGGEGWIYRKADYIVFEYADHWLNIRRETLLKITEEMIKGHTAGGKQEIGSLYTRKGNKYLLTRVPIAVIEQFGKRLEK